MLLSAAKAAGGIQKRVLIEETTPDVLNAKGLLMFLKTSPSAHPPPAIEADVDAYADRSSSAGSSSDEDEDAPRGGKGCGNSLSVAEQGGDEKARDGADALGSPPPPEITARCPSVLDDAGPERSDQSPARSTPRTRYPVTVSIALPATPWSLVESSGSKVPALTPKILGTDPATPAAMSPSMPPCDEALCIREPRVISALMDPGTPSVGRLPDEGRLDNDCQAPSVGRHDGVTRSQEEAAEQAVAAAAATIAGMASVGGERSKRRRGFGNAMAECKGEKWGSGRGGMESNNQRPYCFPWGEDVARA